MHKMFIGLVLFVGCFVACSCSHAQTPVAPQKSFPSAVSDNLVNISLLAQIPNIGSFIAGLNSESCAAGLQELYKEIYQLDPARVDLAELAAKKEVALPQIFALRVQLREKIEQFRQASALSDECLVAARNIFRASRTLEEYAAEYVYKPGDFDRKLHNPLAGGLPNLLVNPKFAGFQRESGLKSGDLLMSRGSAFTSAMIARLGDVDAQFSHIAVLYIDPNTQEKWVMESHIEIGNIVRPFSEYLKDLNFRIVVLRQPDAELAHRSAEYAFHLVKERYDKKDNIPYDFHMRLSDPSDPDQSGDKEIFCSELARIAYREGSTGKFMVPFRLSTYHHHNKDILNRLQVYGETSFAPGDMDVDPRFEVVAEWRDLTRIAQSRYFDAIFSKYFEWMETKGYQLKDANSFAAQTLAPVIFKARRVAWITRLLKLDEKIPLNMTEATFKTFAILGSVVKPLYDFVEKADEKFIKKNGFPLTTGMICDLLEAYREKDSAANIRYRKYIQARTATTKGGEDMENRPWPSDFHSLFSPPDAGRTVGTLGKAP